jgi:hypothetical protein
LYPNTYQEYYDNGTSVADTAALPGNQILVSAVLDAAMSVQPETEDMAAHLPATVENPEDLSITSDPSSTMANQPLEAQDDVLVSLARFQQDNPQSSFTNFKSFVEFQEQHPQTTFESFSSTQSDLNDLAIMSPTVNSQAFSVGSEVGMNSSIALQICELFEVCYALILTCYSEIPSCLCNQSLSIPPVIALLILAHLEE